jgi:hypothetical protein
LACAHKKGVIMTLAKPQNVTDTLQHMKEALDCPCVPGELEPWARAVNEAMTQTGPLVREQLQRNHRDHYSRILEEDAEMYRHVFQLKQADQKLLEAFEALARKGQSLAAQAPKVGWDEARLHDAVDGLVRDGLAFILNWEQQEIALRTWLVEAFTRERGGGD